MEQTANIVLGIIWGALFLSPIIGVVMYFINRKQPAAKSKISIIVFSAIIMLQILFLVTGLSFTNIIYSAALLALAYFSYCMLYSIAMRIEKDAIRFTIMGLGILPVLGGYALATVGILGLAFSIHDEVPFETTAINKYYDAKFYSYGWAFTSEGGVRAEINKHPFAIGFLEYTIFTEKFYDTDYNYITESLKVTLTKDSTGSNVFNFSAEGKLLYSFKE